MGIIQGILEWLPVSSEGQLVFVSTEFFGLGVEIAIRLAIWLHFGTLLAVLYFYRSEWYKISQMENEDIEKVRSLILFATLGTAIVSVPIRILFSTLLNPVLGGILLLLMAIALFFTSYMLTISEHDELRSLGDLTKKEQFIIGMFQGLAIIPGVSRSGTTIGVLLLMRIDKNSSLKGSFLISVPAVLGAIGLEFLLAIIGDNDISSGLSFLGIVLSIIISFVFGILTLRAMINLVKTTNFSLITAILALIFLVGFFLSI